LKGIQKISKQNNNNGIPLYMYQLINKIQLYLVPLYLSVLLNFAHCFSFLCGVRPRSTYSVPNVACVSVHY
jgi:hypothetical protein